MSLNTIAWFIIVLVAVVAYAMLTAEDHPGGDDE